MITKKNAKCIVEIEKDETYTIDSADNAYYDITLNTKKSMRNDGYAVLSIRIDLFTRKYSVALVGSYYTYAYENNVILDDEILTVLQGDTITQLNILDGTISKNVIFSDNELNYEIYKIDDGYLIYGELEIMMLDFDFQRKWSFYGHDIFASVSGKNPFELKNDKICLYDFLDNYYEIDFNGKIIYEKPAS